jgi:hypothetical protein
MQQALQRAALADLFARPVGDLHYSYSYEQCGKVQLIHVHGRNRFGSFQSGPWRSLTQKDIESDWLICDQSGDPVNPDKPRGLTLKELV